MVASIKEQFDEGHGHINMMLDNREEKAFKMMARLERGIVDSEKRIMALEKQCVGKDQLITKVVAAHECQRTKNSV
jgi:hypothetical protein